ncbi:MAG: Ig-like domain-containing protein [Clostridiales bacterium]|nr:Ig-like domain-containing protein [Clostridiales bacterium]
MKHPLPRICKKLLSLVLTAALLVGTAAPLAEAYTHASEFNTGYTIYDGIDVSKWQGTINWSKVAAAGIDFVFIRCGYTSSSSFTLNKDSQFATNIKNAQKYGIQVGVYYFSQAKSTSEAKKEAAYVLKLLSGYDLDLPVAFDAENAGGRFKFSNFTKTQCTNIALAFCAAIEAGGYDACVYNSVSTFSGSGAKYNPTTILNKGYKLWVAHYANTASNSTYSVSGYTYWQYSSTGTVSGISGNVDLDFWYSDDLEPCEEVDDDTAITSLSLNKTSAALSPGDTLSLTATAKPSGTSDPVCWSSSDNSVAYVDSSGTVTAVQSGTATITASSSSGSVTATCKVTVSGDDPDEVIVVTYGDDAFDLDNKTSLTPDSYQALSDSVLTVTKDGATAINGAGVTDVTAEVTTTVVTEEEQTVSAAADEQEETAEPDTTADTDPADEAQGDSSADEAVQSAEAEADASADEAEGTEAEEAVTAQAEEAEADETAAAQAEATEADETAAAQAEATEAEEAASEAAEQESAAADSSDEGDSGVTALSTTEEVTEEKTIRVVVQRLSLTSATLKLKSTSLTYTGSAVTPTVSSLKVGSVSVPSSGYTLYANNNINRGQATATVAGKGNYCGAVSATFYIRSIQTIALTKSSYSVTVGSSAFYLRARNASQYGSSLTYSSSNTSVVTVSSSGKVTVKGLGIATITVTAAQNDRYNKATKKITVKVVPKKVTLSSVKKGKKKITVKWKTTSCSGYQIQYSTSSSFKTYKTVTVSGKSSKSKVISGLKSKKKYYVRVRAYYKSSAGTVYGSWSSKKSVKTK